ncbi:MAG: hypothetical protein HYY30_01670 [Chloroflexi bacterium]|nr:hypothetical protein [Chloroflexota bacterium]
MSMDIISGIVVATSMLMLAIALTGIFAVRMSRDDVSNTKHQEIFSRMRGMQGTLVVIYFVATTHLLLIAQQLSLALGNFVVGLALVVVQFIEPTIRGGRQSPGEQDNWRR